MPPTPLILIALLLFSTSTQGQGAVGEIGVERYVELQPGGILLINDTITLEATPSLYIGQPPGFREERVIAQIYTGTDWKTLDLDIVEKGNIRWLSIHPSTGGATCRLRISYLYVDEVEWRNGEYRLEIPLYPAITDSVENPTPWNITQLTFRAYLPEGAELVEVDSPLPISNSTVDDRCLLSLTSTKPLKALEPPEAAVVYTPSTMEEHPITLESMRVRMHIGWSTRIEEEYAVVNRGGALESLHIMIPGRVRGVRAYDRAGPLKVSSRAGDGGVDIYVYPRFPIGNGERWSFTLRYTVQNKEIITRSKSRYRLNYTLHHPPCYVSRASIVIQLPEGAFPTGCQPSGEANRVSPISYRVSIALGDVMPLEEAVVSVEYRWTPFWLLLRPTLWGLLIAAVSALIAIPLRRRRVEVEEEEKPTILGEFLDLYDRRIGLLLELEELEGELERKEIGRERFERKSAEAHRRLMELSRRLKRLEGRLLEERPDLSEELEELRRAEEELEGVMAALRGLERRLRRRRISRRDYMERRREHVERRRRAIRRIEEAISALRGMA
ncbi:hypothetical protein DRO49_00200 [Candidatus Bathyarchaeota archaeon]|nr:MAG: hypothetical protein DRO49_00200 [Candidatus Bathyarchaeota archaeon]